MIPSCRFLTTSSICRACGPTRYPHARAKHASKTSPRRFAKATNSPVGIEALPRILAAGDFRAVVDRLVEARKSGGGIIWGFGAHVLKTGLSPILVDLMRRGYVSAMATNGAGIIHDFEIALAGRDLGRCGRGAGPRPVRNGGGNRNPTESSHLRGSGQGLGIGQAVGRYLRACGALRGGQRRGAAAELGIPLTVHVAIGTDIIHMHPAASGAAIGEGSLRDFR